MADDKEEEENGEIPAGREGSCRQDAHRSLGRNVGLSVQNRLCFDEDPPSYEAMYPPTNDEKDVPAISNSKLDCGIVMNPSALKEQAKSSPNSNQVVPQTPEDMGLKSQANIEKGESKVKLTQEKEKPKPEKVLQRKITLTKFSETREKLLVQASGLTKGARETLRLVHDLV